MKTAIKTSGAGSLVVPLAKVMDARHYDGTLNGIAHPRPRFVAAVVVAAWTAIGIGAFQKLYVTIHFRDTAALRTFWTEAPFRQIPGLRRLLMEAEARTKPGDRVLLWTPHRPWQGGYGYAFRRAQYVLAGRDVIPLIDRASGVVEERNIARATYIACWPECPPLTDFDVIWRSEAGTLLRRR
jgi:hypothetical protein